MGWLDNLDPTKSSLFTGKGMPWGEGPQDPYQAQYKAFNPSEYKGMDTSALGHALRQDIGQGAARSRGRMQGALQRGGGGGADLISGMAGLEAQQGQDEATMSAKLAQEDYEQRYQQWRDMMGFESEKARRDSERYDRDTKSRSAPWDFLGNVAGTALGGFGGAAGGAAGKKMFG